MQLLHTTKWTFKDFDPGREPPYAILSHTWGNSEIVFADDVPRQKLSEIENQRASSNTRYERLVIGLSYGGYGRTVGKN